ncbi:allophanate hydrolase subunit 1 [Solihabitans fulvus]|uniref:Allophanate hydrolase subunit 1 n=1 Tax=Solihabitans fulvus TaxID=1892852 RepID=A0A5B2XF15_9PSEU|nr:allophanate hydrolase subunit 1 [Solihabitans fulvus]KAA2261392.1 allophanate hydrolase subunit 1 [Solihabitans fulvus]
MTLTVAPYGDSALLATVSGGSVEDRWLAVRRLADAVEADGIPGVLDVVATYDALLVEFDCARTTHDEVAGALRDARGTAAVPTPTTYRIPVVYGGEHGPDLPDVAAQLGLTERDVVRLHTETPWVVRFRGAPAGAPMMDGSRFPAPISRCPRPRTHVPAGSVAVSGRQAVIYPVRSPGGWRLIGRTPLRLLDLGYRPGDVFRFESHG